MSLTWTTPVWMWPLLLVLAAGAVIWTIRVYGRTRPGPPASLGHLLIALRVSALLLLVVALAGPVLSRFFQDQRSAVLAVVMEDSASMGLNDGGWRGDTPAEGPSRWQAALNLTARIDSSLAARNWDGQMIFLRGNGLEPLRRFSPADPVVTDPEALGTDLNHLLAQTGDFLAAEPVRALMLLTDGQETRLGPDRALGSRSQRWGEATVLSVLGVGDPQGAADRLIRDLRYPETVYAGDEAVVELSLTHRFLTDELSDPVTVSLKEGGRVLADTTLVPEGSTSRLELPFQAEAEGLKLLTVEVSPLDNERFLANNKVSLAVNVRRGRSQVLLLAPRPGWDTRFLAQAAQAESRIDLTVVRRGPEGLVFADSLKPWTPPVSKSDWARWDGVVLAGWQDLASQVDWTQLVQAVEDGLGLMVMPEPGPVVQREIPGPPEELTELLPVSFSRLRWLDNGFVTTPVAEGKGHPVLRGLASPEDMPLSGAPGSRGTSLEDLPPLRRILGVQDKPASTPLLVGRGTPRAGEASSLTLLTVGNQGQGRVIWYGGRRLWEQVFWRPGTTGDDQVGAGQAGERLLRNILVWLAAGQQESGLAFSGRQPFYQEGETITLSAQWRDLRGQPVLDRRPSLVLKSQPTEVEGDPLPVERTFALEPVAGQPGVTQVTLPALPPGHYALQLVGAGDPPVTGPEESLVVTAYSVEETQVRQDSQLLNQMALRMGGAYHSLSDSGTLDQVVQNLSAVDWSPELRERRHRWDFWSGWPFFVLVVILLGAEWYLRRRHGLL
jgi:hypothetical protein